MRQAEDAIASFDEPAQGTSNPEQSADSDANTEAQSFDLSELTETRANTEMAALDLINDVELDLRIELGRTNMCLEDVLKLRQGSVVTLDKLAGDPVDVYVNGRIVARGEVLVLNDNFCVRVSELVTGDSVTRKSDS